jgi:hypothetical protein
MQVMVQIQVKIQQEQVLNNKIITMKEEIIMIKIMQELEETQEEKEETDPLWHEFIYSLF